MSVDTRVDDLRAVTDFIIETSTADATEVILTAKETALTRFANNEIHQNVAEANVGVRVRAVLGRRVGVAGTNQLDQESLRAAVERAIETARNQPESDEIPLMAAAAEVRPIEVDASTAEATPDDRAERVALICEPSAKAGMKAFGALSTGVVRYVVANSNGLFVQSPRAIASLKLVTMGDGGTGYAQRCSTRLSDIDAEPAGAEAIDKAARTRGAEPIEPGVYPVVLQEYAVGDILEYLSYMGFSGLSVEEGRSFMRMGEKITGDNVNIWDDGLDPAGLPMRFDFEGVPKKRVDLIKAGVAAGLVHDLASAKRAGTESTGHGLPAPNPYGAMAANLFMGGGDAASREELTQGIKRGVWVTRFHYIGVVHPRQSSLTGMTRDGTFLIEDGKITRPIKDMRFTQSVMEAFEGITALTRDRMLTCADDYGDLFGAHCGPAVQLKAFNFTSVTR